MSTADPQKRKRGRQPSASGTGQPSGPRRGRSKRAETVEEDDTSRPRKRTRKSTGTEDTRGQTSSDVAPPKRRKQGSRQSTSQQLVEESGTPKKRPTRARRSDDASPTEQDAQNAKKQKKQKKPQPEKQKPGLGVRRKARARGSGADATAAVVEEAPLEAVNTDQADEDNDHDNENDEDHDEAAQIPYRQLITQTRLVPVATINNKWTPLDPEAVAAAQALLADCARPVLSHIGTGRGSGSERRQEQCRLAIVATTRRLRSKLAKGIPFPPAAIGGSDSRSPRRRGKGSDGRKNDFDFERTLESIQSLEKQLDPLQHAVALLESQRAYEERALEADYAALRQLETNAQAEMRTWRERSRRLHNLAPASDDNGKAVLPSASWPRTGDSSSSSSSSSNFHAEVELVKNPADHSAAVRFDGMDKELVDLCRQLGSHMESLRSNLQQVEGVVPAMAQSKAALQQVLRRHLDTTQFERLVLGD